MKLTEEDKKDALSRLQEAGRLINEARRTLKLTPKEFVKKYDHKLTVEQLAYIERGFIVETNPQKREVGLLYSSKGLE